jgi:oxepin-CoA hydrolase / 3-oxo-5,6-dehydrosuberyl-CoA semialdehyde dehydrogenase
VRVADAERGAYPDTPLISAGPDAAAPHEVEPFGPAAAVGAASPPSAVSDDLTWTTAFVRETAPWHGRPHLLDSTAGPAEARKRGIRGVVDLTQRTALQTPPPLLDAL